MVIQHNCKLGRESAPYGDTDYTHKAVLYPEQFAEHSFLEVLPVLKYLHYRLLVT